jgi:hypothetical protein
MIRWVFKWIFRFALLAVVLVAVVFFCRDLILAAVVENRIAATTGLDVRLAKMRTGLGRPYVSLEGLRVFNPAEYGGGIFLEIPDLHIEVDPDQLRGGKLKFRLVRIAVSQLTIVKARDGTLNMDALQKRAERASGGTTNAASDISGVDTLNLTLGKVRYVDLSQGGKEQQFDLAIHEQVFKNLKTVAEFQQAFVSMLLRRGISFMLLGGSPVIAPVQAPVTNAPQVVPPKR